MAKEGRREIERRHPLSPNHPSYYGIQDGLNFRFFYGHSAGAVFSLHESLQTFSLPPPVVTVNARNQLTPEARRGAMASDKCSHQSSEPMKTRHSLGVHEERNFHAAGHRTHKAINLQEHSLHTAHSLALLALPSSSFVLLNLSQRDSDTRISRISSSCHVHLTHLHDRQVSLSNRLAVSICGRTQRFPWTKMKREEPVMWPQVSLTSRAGKCTRKQRLNYCERRKNIRPVKVQC